MTNEEIEKCTVGQKTTFGEIKKYLFDEVMQELKLKELGKYALTPVGKKQQKFEKIEKMAWNFYNGLMLKPATYLLENKEDAEKLEKTFFAIAWGTAETFYNMAKKKQEGANESENNET